MKRSIDIALIKWKKSKGRKVLLLRGARQVGKTYAARTLGKEFENFVEFNFEENPSLKHFFEGPLDPESICEQLSVYSENNIVPGKTLLFFDEIQTCPNAIRSLRFFYEKLPELHVIAAGSLLEFALSEIPSFGVGRIESLFMYPMSCYEVFSAIASEKLSDSINNPKNLQTALSVPLHQKAIKLFKLYQLIGGMPEIVDSYKNQRDITLCQKKLDALIQTMQDDFAKYKSRTPVAQLWEVFQSIAQQTGQKFTYSNIDSASTQYHLKQALDLLIQAGIAHKITHCSAQGFPLGASINPKKFKVIPLDVGIHQRLLKLNLADYMSSDSFSQINKGNIAETVVGLELLHYSWNSWEKGHLYYWHREHPQSNAEVDYISNIQNNIIPIEVKAGTKGQMQSLYQFLDTHTNSPKGIRISLENFNHYDRIQTIPLYAIKSLF